MFKPSRSLQVVEVLEYLSSVTQVRSSQGSLEARAWKVSGQDTDAEGSLEQGLIDLANISHCVTELEKQQHVKWAATDVLPQFAAKIKGTRPGGLAVAVLRAYQPWHLDVDKVRPAGTEGVGADRGPSRGLTEVYRYMRTIDRSLPEPKAPEDGHKKAGALLADASIVLIEWVEMWNRKAGFKNHLSVAEFSRRYELPESTVRMWCQNGRLPAVMVGNGYKIDVTDLEEG